MNMLSKRKIKIFDLLFLYNKTDTQKSVLNIQKQGKYFVYSSNRKQYTNSVLQRQLKERKRTDNSGL